jgi:hypothetical protein
VVRACCAAQAARLHSRWVDVQGEVARTITEYDAQTSGPTKWPCLTTFLQQQYGHMVADFVQRCEAEADKKVCACCCHACCALLDEGHHCIWAPSSVRPEAVAHTAAYELS